MRKKTRVGRVQKHLFQIVLAVKYVHSLNLSHRDLKLENILLADNKSQLLNLQILDLLENSILKVGNS